MTNGTAEVDPLQWASTLWFAVYVTECIMIFTINAATLLAFARNHHLRKRTTYLIINLTVADLLVGVVTEPMDLYSPQVDLGSIWQHFVISILYNMFPVSSLTNLSLIALERLHATLCPFRHCLIEKGFYFKTILCSWLLTLLLSSVLSVSKLYESLTAQICVWASHIILTLLILTISYVIIIVNVKSNPPPQPSSSLASDRKLSVTLLMVTVVSILTILPYAVYVLILVGGKWYQLSKATQFHIRHAIYVLYYASSLVNPLIYAIRMKEFRKVVKDLICKRGLESSRVQPIELRVM